MNIPGVAHEQVWYEQLPFYIYMVVNNQILFLSNQKKFLFSHLIINHLLNNNLINSYKLVNINLF